MVAPPPRLRLLAVVGVVGISFSAIFVRLADESFSTTAFFRVAYALPVLGLLAWRRRRDDQRSRRERALALLAGVFLGIDFAFWHRAIAQIGAGLATVLGNTQVVFVALAAWWLLGERPARRALIALPLVLGGVVLISGLGDRRAYGSDPWSGVVYGILTGVTYAAFLLLFRRSNRRAAPAVGPLFEATFAAAVTSLLIGFADGGLELVPSWPSHGWLVTFALVSQCVGWLLISRALPRLPALETSILLLLQPLLTVLWGRLLFAEQLAAVQWLGVATVIAGIGWISLGGAVEKPALKVKS
ncbi:MAG: DMT family transporter [Acidobacteriota bacterium]